MKYVALLSGGKDSCYNLVHCAQNGHELIAAASLRPEDGKEELDSYMYQTVGQDAIEIVAQALDVPFYRRVISGAAVEQGSEYGTRSGGDATGVQGDETEDLLGLLSSVKMHHPDVLGVSVGAILSNYQRVRVEHVCRRLGLTSLAYLWQRDQAELLAEMVEAGMHAILIKVAGIGLKPLHLGKSLAEMQPLLVSLNERYGSHICGEGGEYETLTLDCPLFKRRIVLTETETVLHSDNDFATVAYLRVKAARLEAKILAFSSAIVPPLLEEDFEHIQDVTLRAQAEPDAVTLYAARAGDRGVSVTSSSIRNGPWLAIAGVQGPAASRDQPIEDEVRKCFTEVQSRLEVHSMRMVDLAFISVYLSDMDLFPAVNTVYGSYFGTSPPARACVAVDLPSNVRVQMDCIACTGASPMSPPRQALHVQGLSYWAPANIGPYSQAILANERLFISGQIGLIPSSLILPSPQSIARETALCFQHAARITAAVRESSGTGWEGHSQLVLYWLAEARDISAVRAASKAYVSERGAPTLFVAVKSLPRAALVEKQVLMHTGRMLSKDEDDDEPVWTHSAPQMAQGELAEAGQAAYWSSTSRTSGSPDCTLVCVRAEHAELADAFVAQLREALPGSGRTLLVRAFHVGSWTASHVATLRRVLGEDDPVYTNVPCRAVSTQDADGWTLALCIVYAPEDDIVLSTAT